MISLVTAAPLWYQELSLVMLDSIVERTSLIKEVLMARQGLPPNFHHEDKLRDDIIFKEFSVEDDPPLTRGHGCWAHTLGIHKALRQATQPYIMLCDADIFFYPGADDFYIDCIERYGLNIVGIARPDYGYHSIRDFPCIMNCVVKRDTLPGPDWLLNHRIVPDLKWNPQWDYDSFPMVPSNHWLLPGPTRDHHHRFPDPGGFFDTGCNLFLWNQDRQGRSLSFLPSTNLAGGLEGKLGNSLYTSVNIRSNFGLTGVERHMPILFHKSSGGTSEEFLQTYRS